jgi:hypothetical protein
LLAGLCHVASRNMPVCSESIVYSEAIKQRQSN